MKSPLILCTRGRISTRGTYSKRAGRAKKDLFPILKPSGGDKVRLLAGDYNTEPVLLLDNESTASNPSDELLTVSEMAKWFKVSETTIRRLQQSRKIPFKKIGGAIRFLRSDVLEHLKRCGIEAIVQ